MKRTVLCLAVVGACLSGQTSARAQVLLAADDKSQLVEVELAKVMAQDSSLWLDVRLAGSTRLALVSSVNSVETSASSDAWLRGLDRATRVQVSPPPGPLAACPNRTVFPEADSGLPEPMTLTAETVTTVGSELELRRSLENAGISADVSQLDAFSAEVAAPFQISWFDSPAAGGSTSVVRLIDHGHPDLLPTIRVAGLNSIPITFIGLAEDSVLPDQLQTADTSELAVTYFANSGTTDYAKVRGTFALENQDRWLVEAADLAIVTSEQAGDPDGQVASAELAGQALRATRWLGSLTQTPPSFHVAAAARQEPHVVATDFDTTDCALLSSPEPASSTPGRVAPIDPPASVTGRSGAAVETSTDPTDSDASDGSCNTQVVGSSSDDSCSGDPSAPDSAPSDSCSGDSSTSDSSSDDSCSGDSKSSKSDDSGYDGDTCSGDTSNSATGKSSAALDDDSAESRRKPRKVRLSLLTLLAAGLSLPLRRRFK